VTLTNLAIGLRLTNSAHFDVSRIPDVSLSLSLPIFGFEHLEHSEAVERLERLERTGPRGERSKAVELEIPRMVS
jgi:hypothetical protein